MIRNNGTTTFGMSTAPTTQNIAHGLGRIPDKVRIKAVFAEDNPPTATAAWMSIAETVYNGTTQSSNFIYMSALNTGGSGGEQGGHGSSFRIPDGDS